MIGYNRTSNLNIAPACVNTGSVTEGVIFDMNILTDKRCTKCEGWKNKSEFHKDKSRKDALFPWCKECVKENTTEYYKNNAERIRQSVKEYRLANPEKIKSNKILWVKNNPEKRRKIGLRWYHAHKMLMPRFIRGPNIERNKEKSRQWAREHPDRRAEQQRNRRAQKKGSGGKITAAEWRALKEFYDYTCLRCGQKEPDVKLTLDHVKPLKLGGTHTIDNAQPLCLSCNCSKQAKHIDYR
jgi:5-methylcytosine-specific restriction endonuclease McrA